MSNDVSTVGIVNQQKITTHKLTPLRKLMIEDMQKRSFHPLTHKMYIRAVLELVKHCGKRSPEQISLNEARAFLHYRERHGETSAVLANLKAGIRFLYEITLKQVWKPISALRRRMIEDMELAGFSLKTQASYARAVADLSAYNGNKSPALLSNEEIRRYFVHLKVDRKLARQTVTISLCGIKFFYEKTLKRDFDLVGIPVPKRHRTMPVVLSVSETRLILGKIHEPRFRAILTLIYVCGMRLGEACRLAPTDVDSGRGLLHIRKAKGGADRYVPVDAKTIDRLREYWKTHHNKQWLFPALTCGNRRGSPTERNVALSAVQKAFRLARKASGVKKAATVHTLRHSYATHLLEQKVPLRVIQDWLGHRSPSTTSRYTHMTEFAVQDAAQQVGKFMSDL